MRAFRRVEYAAYQLGGRWWLGRKVGAAGSYDLVTGPLRSPSDSGLVFHYYDSTGTETSVDSLVHRVELPCQGDQVAEGDVRHLLAEHGGGVEDR